MKLLLCTECQDVIRLIDIKRTCRCGKIGGKYTDNINAIYFGDTAIPIGFANSTLIKAINNQSKEGAGENFTAFVIPKFCPTLKFVLKHKC